MQSLKLGLSRLADHRQVRLVTRPKSRTMLLTTGDSPQVLRVLLGFEPEVLGAVWLGWMQFGCRMGLWGKYDKQERTSGGSSIGELN